MGITFITGANKRLGFETARRLKALGHTVLIGARDAERGQQATDTLGARFVQTDVTDDDSVAAAVSEVRRMRGTSMCSSTMPGVRAAARQRPI